MFDVGDLPVLTFSRPNCVLKTGVIKWPLKLYLLFLRYDTIRYFNVRSKADISQLNLPHGTDN